jgi:vancomycin resistance protein VanW
VLLAERTTVYPKDWPSRNQNLLTASRYLCGRLLRPGQILSFNAVIGPTTRERGYDVGPTFVGDRVVPGWGGGVCQVASTLYGVARWAAVEVVERHPHGLRVPYVPPGEDATVSSPYLDLVVRNSTPGNLLVAAGAQGPKVTVALFGTVAVGRGSFRHRILSETPFREIRLADPTLPQGKEVEVQEGVPGAVAHTWYTVHYPDGTQRTFDLGVDHYRPTARVVRYGTKPTS